MFSGIVDRIGEIQRVEPSPTGKQIVIRAEGYWDDLTPGASVAVDGVCLTIVARDLRDARFDVVPETLKRSTLGDAARARRVNLQKSLIVGDRIDGHFVQGHVDAVATVEQACRDRESSWHFALAPYVLPCVIPKGSIAIDGVSLTVASVSSSGFSVALIPTTLERTTFGEKRVGDAVNIETDILVRSVVHHLESIQRTRIQP